MSEIKYARKDTMCSRRGISLQWNNSKMKATIEKKIWNKDTKTNCIRHEGL